MMFTIAWKQNALGSTEDISSSRELFPVNVVR